MLRRKFASLGLVALLALAGVACSGEEAETEDTGTEATEETEAEATEEATEEAT